MFSKRSWRIFVDVLGIFIILASLTLAVVAFFDSETQGIRDFPEEIRDKIIANWGKIVNEGNNPREFLNDLTWADQAHYLAVGSIIIVISAGTILSGLCTFFIKSHTHNNGVTIALYFVGVASLVLAVMGIVISNSIVHFNELKTFVNGVIPR